MNNAEDQKRAAATRTVPTRTWFIAIPAKPPADDDRLDGMDAFITELNNAPAAERARCILDPCYAKQKFAEWGGFYLEGEGPYPGFEPIPASTVIRVYESEHSTVPPRHRSKRDEQVVIILDNRENQLRTPTWRCTYTPYSTATRAATQNPQPS